MTFINPIKLYIPYVVLVSDWAVVGAYTYYNAGLPILMLFSIIGILAISSILRLGTTIGLGQAIGILIAFVLALFATPDMNFRLFQNNLTAYIPGITVAVVMILVSGIWHNSLDEENSVTRKEVRAEVEETRKRLENMRDRAKAFAQMATRLNATLDYNKILDATLDVGRLSVRDDSEQRIVSLALIVNSEYELEVASHRGLQFSDGHVTFEGEKGIIAQAMDEGIPIVMKGGEKDPELRKIRAFMGINTTLCIPLRAHFETYGVLIFGTTAENAIHEDHIDTLEAIGVQTAIALRNSVLYTDLREEKERIIKIEENARQALVRDLHDIPTQTISAVAMHLSTLPIIAERKPETLKAEVENIREMALRATEEIRHVMFTLRPLALETQGLSAALKQLAEKMEQTYKQPMQVVFDPRIENALTHDERGTLFYLIEEAANNSRKYAKASMITVKGTLEGSQAIIRIRDNGEGFDSESVNSDYESRGSFGMVNMRERAELINASFELQSSFGKGTLVTVRVPVEGYYEPNAVKPITNKPTKPKESKKPRNPLRKKQYSGPLSPSK
jgi:signal transduction histidine kinase